MTRRRVIAALGLALAVGIIALVVVLVIVPFVGDVHHLDVHVGHRSHHATFHRSHWEYP